MDLRKLIIDLFTFHKGKTIGAILGLAFGLFTIVFGFWKAFFISICILVGFYIGKRVDENEEFKNLLKKFWS